MNKHETLRIHLNWCTMFVYNRYKFHTSSPVVCLWQTCQTACYRISPGAVHHTLAKIIKMKRRKGDDA